MSYFLSFLFCGFLCLIAQIILDNTKWSPGHITSLFVVFGSFLGVFGLYEKIIYKVGGGAIIPITSFGNSLVTAAMTGYSKGLYGICSNMLKTTSSGIVSVIIFSFFISLFFKPRN